MLSPSELERVRTELGYNAIGVGAEPYISTVRVFDDVVNKFITSGNITTSTTLVTAVTPPSGPQPVTLTLASAVGFGLQDRIWVDLDARSEAALVESVSGNDVVVLLAKDHGPDPYPVTVERGEAIVREILATIAAIKAKLGAQGKGSSVVWSAAGLKRADEVEWYGPVAGMANGASPVAAALRSELMAWRDELASVCGVQNYWRVRMGQGLGVVNY